MEATTKIQFYIFITSIYGGLISGLAYDIYRTARYYSRPGKFIAIIADLLFWAGISLVFFYIINKNNLSNLRGYIFIGFFLGGFIYFKTLSRILLPIWMKLFKCIIIIIKKVFIIIVLPFKYMKKLLSPGIKRISKIRKIPREAVKEILRYKKMISGKK